MPLSVLLHFLLAAIILTAAGRTVASLVGRPINTTPTLPLERGGGIGVPACAATERAKRGTLTCAHPLREGVLDRNLIGYAVGLVIFAYGLLAIGLLGLLHRVDAFMWLGLLFLAGLPQLRVMLSECGRTLTTCFHPPRLVWLTIGVLLFFNGVSLIGCFAPPIVGLKFLSSMLTEYDSIAYHLADPKLYIEAHRIYPIYWESHSNFAFTGEMWYMYALLTGGGVPLAKLFHWSCGLAASLATFRIALRFLGLRTASIATIVFASTPLVFWEAGTAYVDLIATYFGTITLLALAVGIADSDEHWITVSAVLMGLMLSSKATAVTALALFAAGQLYWRLRLQRQAPALALGRVAVWCVIAVAVGCPWYVKSIIYTGNPIYPFYYQIFGGRYWDASIASTYDQSNASFGLGRQPVNLLLAPWNLVMYLMPGHPAPLYPLLGTGNQGAKPFNNFPTELATLSPLLLAALYAPLMAFGRRAGPTSADGIPRAVRWLALYALASFVLWFFSMQYVRYLLPLYPVLCMLAAWTVDRALSVRAVTGWALAGFTAISVIASGSIGVSLASVQLPVATGAISADQYISQGDGAYDAMLYINNRLPAGSRVVFYNNPLGFYCDKPYLWGERGHSAYIPYGRMKSAGDLLQFYHTHGITHVLVSLNGFDWPPSPQDSVWQQRVWQLTGGASSPVFDDNGVLIYALPGAK